MSYMTAIEPTAIETVPLHRLRDSLSRIAKGMDARFVAAGRTLASAHELIEAIIASLDGITGALDGEAGRAAVADMQATADYLLTLPALQAERAASIDAIKSAGDALMRYVAQIERTLSFLHICGLNLKVASAGAEEFAGFVDDMFSRLDFAQEEVRGLEGDVRTIGAGISGMVDLNKALAAQCRKVIPQVPRKLVSDAEALRAHQQSTAALTEKVALLARDTRQKIGVAIGALQIGDTTRQRLEHVAEGIAMLEAWRAGQDKNTAPTPATAPATATVCGHIAALLAAQADDALQLFRKEVRVLTDSLDGLGPDAMRLLSIRDDQDTLSGGDTNVLRALEQGIADVDHVTVHLHRAFAQNSKLGSETTAMADRLSRRLRAVRKVQRDVAQMAWNTGLKCRNMGQDGQGLAVMSTEIRNFATSLAGIWTDVSDTFDRLVAGATRINDAEAPADTQGSLTLALERIRAGGERLEASLEGLGQQAPKVARLIRETEESLDCDGALTLPLSDAVTELKQFARPARTASVEPAAPLMDGIAALYTMAREREVHRRFAIA